MKVQRTTFRARYAETDAMGVVHHAAYLPWLEVGRVNLLREAGMPYGDIEARGFLIVLSDIQVRYRRPARFDDLVTVESMVTQAKRRRVSFGYRILLHDTHDVLVEAETQHIVVSRGTMRATQLPDDLFVGLLPWIEEIP